MVRHRRGRPQQQPQGHPALLTRSVTQPPRIERLTPEPTRLPVDFCYTKGMRLSVIAGRPPSKHATS